MTRSTIDGGSIGLHVAVDGNATIAIENSDNLIRRTTTGMLFEHANTSATTTCSVQSTNDRLLENSTGALFRMNRGSGSIEIDSAIVARNRSRGLETRSTTHRVTVRSATFADNGIGTYGRYSSTQRFSHCAFGGNSTDTVSAYPSAFTYCCFERGSVSGTGNLNRTDPQLVRPFYKLSPNSPCVDAGSTTASLPPTDYEGDPRKSVGRANGPFRADIGADEYIYGGTSRSYGTPGFAEFGCFPEMAREQVSCRIGATLRIDLDGAWYPFFRVPCRSATLAIGAQDDSGSRLPFELSSLGARGSMLWTDTLYLSGPIRVGGTGTATATLRIPNSTRLVGMTICAQWAVLTDRMNVATSDGLRATFGR